MSHRCCHVIHRLRFPCRYSNMRHMEDINLLLAELLSVIQSNNTERLKEISNTDSSVLMRKLKVLSKKRKRKAFRPPKKLPLISAIEDNNLEMVRTLLTNGANSNDLQETSGYAKRRDTFYPIHRAVALNFIDLAEILLTAGANPNVFDDSGNTPLHIAVGHGNSTMVKLLLSFEADPTLVDRRGNTPIHISVSQGHLNIVRTLIDFNASVHQMNSVGYQPIHIAAAAGHFHITHLLCSLDASNVKTRSRDGQFPLHLAAENGHVETVTALLELFGANPNERDSSGNVPLLCLLSKLYRRNIMRDMVFYDATFMALVQYGTSLDVTDSNGKTIADIAVENHYTKIASALKTLSSGVHSGQELSEGNRGIANSRRNFEELICLKGSAENNGISYIDTNSNIEENTDGSGSEKHLFAQDFHLASFRGNSQIKNLKQLSNSEEISVTNNLCKKASCRSSRNIISHLPHDTSTCVQTVTCQGSDSAFTSKQTSVNKSRQSNAETTSVLAKGSNAQTLCVTKELDHNMGLDAELGAFNKSIGLSDEDFSEDFLSEDDSTDQSIDDKTRTDVLKSQGSLQWSNNPVQNKFREKLLTAEDESNMKHVSQSQLNSANQNQALSSHLNSSRDKTAILKPKRQSKTLSNGESFEMVTRTPNRKKLDDSVAGVNGTNMKSVSKKKLSREINSISDDDVLTNYPNEERVTCMNNFDIAVLNHISTKKPSDKKLRPSTFSKTKKREQGAPVLDFTDSCQTQSIDVKNDNNFVEIMSLDVVNSCSQLNAIQNPSLDEQEYKVQSNTEEKGKKQIEKKKSLKMHSKIKEPPVDREVILDAFPLKANIIKLSSLEMLSGDNDPPIGRKKSVKSRQQKEILNSSSVSNNDSELVKSKRKKSERESQSVHQSFTAESELDYMMLELTEDSNAVVCAQRSQDSTDKGLIRSRSSKGKKRKKTLQSDAGNDQSASEIFSRSDHLEASQSEEYGVTDVDSIPFFLDLADKEDRVFQPSFSEDLVGISGNSGSKLKGSRRTKDIRSELSFAFGISEETNIDDFLLNFNENYGNNDVFERKSPSEMNGYCETTEKVEKKILPRKSKNSRKSKVLHKSFEFVTNADESKVNEKSRPLSAHTVEGGPTRVSHRRSTRSPCLCLHPDNSGSSSLLPPETETQCENQRLSVESSDHQSLVSCLSANSNSYGAQKMANVSKETCIDDDYLEEEQEKKVILDEPMSVLFSHRFKEINIDEFCCSDKVQLNSDLPPESSVDAGNSAAACAYGYESSLNQPPLVDDQSVLEDSFPKKKLQRRKKSQNKLVRRKNETTDDEVGQLQELQNDCCSLQQEMAKEPIQTSFDIADDCQSKETLDPLVVNGVLDVDIENGGIEQEPFHDDGNQQTTADEMDVVVRQEFQDNKKVLSVQKEPTVLLSASEDSQTESDGDSSDSYDTAKDEILKDLLFSQSRSLFTIKEMNVEESEIGNEFTRPGAEKTMKCELVEEPDDWDDVDLTGICGKPLEKIGLTSRILGIQRNLYEEMDEEEEENEVNSSSKCLTSPSLKSFDVSPLMVEKTFTIPSLNISHGKPPPRTPNKHKRNTTKFSDNSNSDDESLVHTKDDTPSSKEPEEDSMDNTHPQQKKNNVSTGSFAETNFDDVEPVSLSYGECSLENATNNDGSVVPPSDQDALGCYEVKQDISKLSVNSDKELSPADNKQTESFPYSNKIVKATKQSKRSKERKNHILTNDVSNDDVVTMLSLKQSSEKEMEDDKKLGKENKVKEMKESTDKYPSVHALQQLKPLLDSASNDKDQAPDQGSPKKRLEVNQQTEDLEIGNELDEKNKVVANNEEDENGLSKEFSRQQMGRVSRGHQKKKAVRVPLATGSGKKPVLVFESPPDIVAKQLLIENEVDPIKSDVGNQSVTKSVSFCLSSFSEKLPSDSPDGRSHEPSGNTSRPKSDIPLPGEQKVRGKPPVPQNLEKQLINDSINKGNLPEFKVLNDNCLDDKKNMARKLPPKSISLSNQAHRTPESGSPVVPLSPEKPNDQTQVSKDSKQGLTGTFSNVRNPKFLIESSLIRQRTRTERIPKHHTLAQQSSYEDSRRRSRRSAEHNFSFERPRSADGILEARQHQPNRPRPRQPANAAISSSEAVRRKTSGNQVTGDKHVIVRDTQKTLQEAAFESITASLLDQTRQQTRRSVRSSDSSVSYFQGVYRPQALSFRSSLSHDDSRNSADFGFHQTSQSANNSWQGND